MATREHDVKRRRPMHGGSPPRGKRPALPSVPHPRRPRPIARPKRATVELRVDADVLEALRARASRLGVGYQALINTLLASAVARGRPKAPHARRRVRSVAGKRAARRAT
jgi:uncharacterized protein (DUF4415 family)